MPDLHLSPISAPVKKDQLTLLAGSTALSAQEDVLKLFVFNMNECLCAMERSITAAEPYRWNMATSELKVICDMLGAVRMQSLCEHAEQVSSDLVVDRRTALSRMQEELNRVRAFLRDMD